MRRLPPLGAIEAFVQVARLGSVKAAATELALSAPALSRRVQSLERFIGRPLVTYSKLGSDDAQNRAFMASIVKAMQECTPVAITPRLGGAIAGLTGEAPKSLTVDFDRGDAYWLQGCYNSNCTSPARYYFG